MNKFSIQTGDIFGGLTAGIVALPLALAFGVQSGMGAEAGLYGAIALGIFAALFGGTGTQISGPTGPMSVVSAAVIASIIALKGGLEAALPLILLTFFLAGALQIVMGLLGVGQYIRYIPYPVVSGFMTGIGVIIILLQVFPSFGHPSPSSIISVFREIGTIVKDPNWHAVALTGIAIAIIYLLPRITKAVPSTLVALIIASLIPAFIPMQVAVIGDIPTGLPKIYPELFLAFGDIQYVLLSALTLAALGSIDSLLTSVVADNITRTTHNSKKELIGQGIGNMVSGMIGGLPGAGATMRTLVNIRAGGKTRVSGFLHGIVLLLILVVFSPWAAQIPLPVLAGILITVGIGIVDRRGILHINRVTRTDAVVMVIVLVLTVFVDLLQAVAAGLIISSILFMKRVGDITKQQSQTTMHDDEEENQRVLQVYRIPDEYRDDVVIKKVGGPLFFGSNDYFQGLARLIPKHVRVLLFDMTDMPYIDQSGLYTLEDIILRMEQHGTQVFFLGLQKQPGALMKNIRLIPDLVEEECIFDDRNACIESIQSYLKTNVISRPEPVT